MKQPYIVCLLAKFPTPNLSKTRLGKDIGMDLSAQLSDCLIKDTVDDLLQNNISFLIETDSQESLKSFSKLYPHILISTGKGTNIAERIDEIFEKYCLFYEKVICVYTDVPNLSVDILNKAIRKLDSTDIVIGPDDGGGLYLIGAKRYLDIFKIQSTKKYCDTIINNCKTNNVFITLIEILFDIDIISDLEKIDLEKIKNSKPRTFEFMTSNTIKILRKKNTDKSGSR